MSDNRIIECMERAQYLLGNLMAVKSGEEVLIVVDPQTDERMTQAMAAAALNCGAEYGVYMMPIRGKDKATIFPKSLELGMDACDVFVGMTTASGAAIYNNHLKELINQKKLREVSICLRSIDNFTRGGALADYEAVYADGEKLQAQKLKIPTTSQRSDLDLTRLVCSTETSRKRRRQEEPATSQWATASTMDSRHARPYISTWYSTIRPLSSTREHQKRL